MTDFWEKNWKTIFIVTLIIFSIYSVANNPIYTFYMYPENFFIYLCVSFILSFLIVYLYQRFGSKQLSLEEFDKKRRKRKNQNK